jgi:hypothetical protein
MKQEGYILLTCLLTIAILSLLSLALMEQSRWQQRLTSMLIIHNQQDIAINLALSKLTALDHEGCTIDWQKSDEAFERLNRCQPCCALRQDNIQIRYLMINGYINEPPQFSVIAHVNGELWRKFQLERSI